MTPEQIKNAVLAALSDVAPELDAQTVNPKAQLRDQLDLDSMDFLNFVLGLHKAFGVEIPEADYRKLATLESAVAYLDAKVAVQ